MLNFNIFQNLLKLQQLTSLYLLTSKIKNKHLQDGKAILQLRQFTSYINSKPLFSFTLFLYISAPFLQCSRTCSSYTEVQLKLSSSLLNVRGFQKSLKSPLISGQDVKTRGQSGVVRARWMDSITYSKLGPLIALMLRQPPGSRYICLLFNRKSTCRSEGKKCNKN